MDVAVGSHARKGLLCGIMAYIWWGLIPLYFKSVASVPSPLVLDHRIIWSAGLLALIVTWQRRWPDVLGLLRQPRKIGLLLCASVLIAANWGVFIYAVASSRTMQASLGYFINPLLSIVLGMAVLRERLRPIQWLAVVIASIGVAYLTWRTGEFPWIAMLCAGTFAFYGLVRKLAAVPSIDGLAIETLVLLLPAIAILKPLTDQAPAISPPMYLLLSLSGVITVLPLFWFNVAVQHLRLTTIGFLQYIGPTGQFFVALLAFREPFDHDKLIAFSFCWAAVAVYSWNAWRTAKASASQITETPLPIEA